MRSSRDHSSFSIVIADDSPLYRKLLHDTLAREHYRVLVAENGSRALELVTQVHPEVLITDWDMPVVNGLDLCRQIREMTVVQDFLPH